MSYLTNTFIPIFFFLLLMPLTINRITVAAVDTATKLIEHVLASSKTFIKSQKIPLHYTKGSPCPGLVSAVCFSLTAQMQMTAEHTVVPRV